MWHANLRVQHGATIRHHDVFRLYWPRAYLHNMPDIITLDNSLFRLQNHKDERKEGAVEEWKGRAQNGEEQSQFAH